MNAKKLTIIILSVIFVLFTAISAFVYDNSDSVKVICYKGSYAEEYSKKHNLDYELISDSDAYIGIWNEENFEYNHEGNLGEIVSYTGESEKLVIPQEINGITITKIKETAFDEAKNIKTLYLPKTVTEFGPINLENITVYVYEDTDLYKTLTENKEIKFEIKTIPDSFYIDFSTTSKPLFSCNNISDKSVEITLYQSYSKLYRVPESVNGKIVTDISFDVLSAGAEAIIIPKSVTTINSDLYSNRYDINFLMGVLIALLGYAFAITIALTAKINTKEKLFLSIPQFKKAFSVFVLSILLACTHLYINIIPNILVYVLFALVLGLAVVFIIKARTAAELVENIDNKIKEQTFFIKSLTVDAECLMNNTKSPEFITITKRVYEAVRYSDPLTNDALVVMEAKIQNSFSDFENAVNNNDYELALSNAEQLIALIDARNKKCKFLK